jgi:hypothetical protein
MLESHLSDLRLVHRASQLIFSHSKRARGLRTLISSRPEPSSWKLLERIAIKALAFFERRTEARSGLGQTRHVDLHHWWSRCSRGKPVELN